MTKTNISRPFLALALVAALAGWLGAGIPMAAAQQQLPQVPITGALVQSFIKSYPAVKKQADGLSQKYNVKADKSSAANSWGAWLAASAAWGELDATVKPFGFAGFKVWLDDTISIAMAYGFAKAGPQLDAGLAQAVEQIRNNPNIPEAQKKVMLDQLQGSTGAIAGSRPPQANIDAVGPYLAQLAVLFQ